MRNVSTINIERPITITQNENNKKTTKLVIITFKLFLYYYLFYKFIHYEFCMCYFVILSSDSPIFVVCRIL